MSILICGNYQLPLNRPLIMGIVNVTPDSFSDGNIHATTTSAVEHALKLIEQGADIIDIGGESTRPGAMPVSVQDELERVIPVIKALQQSKNSFPISPTEGGRSEGEKLKIVQRGIPLSIDTYKPEVMRAAIAAGASMVNDINALVEEGALDAIAQSNVAVCLMHKQGTPQTMQLKPQYQNVLTEIKEFLQQRIYVANAAGITRERLVIDPGFGFGKTLDHNLTLLRHLDQFQTLHIPLLVGLSRKSILGMITGRPIGERIHAGIAAALLAVMKGAKILRVHDVAATKDALAVFSAIENKTYDD